MSKSLPIQAIDQSGRIIHSFPSIAAAGASGFSHSTINKSLHHGGRPVDGLRWQRANRPAENIPSLLTRLEEIVSRLEKQCSPNT
jgi:hypothetical protein